MSHRDVRVKICGLTCVAEARGCVDAGVDWIGLNFHPGSPRCIDHARAADIIAALEGSISVVGVFVDRPVAEVADVADRLGLVIVQLHGREPREDLVALAHQQVIKAFRLDCASSWTNVTHYLQGARDLGRLPDAVLIDTYAQGLRGGTGITLANETLDCIPPLPPLILAGGLNPENVAERVARVRPWMVDVASGVESAPGRKDLARVAAFVQAVRGVECERQRPENVFERDRG